MSREDREEAFRIRDGGRSGRIVVDTGPAGPWKRA